MFNYVDEDFDDEDEKCRYTPKYGKINVSSTPFDDHCLLGKNFYQYKPYKIIFWTTQDKKITGIQTWFKNAVDSNCINSGENKGSLSCDIQEFVINANEYLTDYEIWLGNGYISGILLRTNKNSEFFVGEKKGNIMDIPVLSNKKNVIVSFFGSYNQYLESFGLHLMDYKDYMKVLFTGYFELKAKLKKDKYREEIMEKMRQKKFNFQEETIIKTCLLPSTPFNEVMKFCAI